MLGHLSYFEYIYILWLGSTLPRHSGAVLIGERRLYQEVGLRWGRVLDSDCRRQSRIWGQMSIQSTTKDVTSHLEEVPANWKTTLTKLRKYYLAFFLRGFEEWIRYSGSCYLRNRGIEKLSKLQQLLRCRLKLQISPKWRRWTYADQRIRLGCVRCMINLALVTVFTSVLAARKREL